MCEDGIQWVTRGDSVGGNDAPISSQELLGRVISIERGSRRLTPHQSSASRLISWILCRSEPATRVVLGIMGWGLGERGKNQDHSQNHSEVRDARKEIL